MVYEQSERAVRVTVRDDGAGMAEGRLAEAERDSRLGVAGSIRRPVVEVGGTRADHVGPGFGHRDRAGGSAAMTRVMVVDDHPIWRDALERDLVQAGHEVVGAFGDGETALRLAPAVRPEVVLMDLELPGISGVDAAAGLIQQDPSRRILMFSASGEDASVIAAIKVGALGYLVKSASRDELLRAVERTEAGEATFSPGLAALVLNEYRKISAGPAPDMPTLTARETEILRLVPPDGPPARSPSSWWCRIARCRTTSRTRCASCNCTTGSSSPGGPSTKAWPTAKASARCSGRLLRVIDCPSARNSRSTAVTARHRPVSGRRTKPVVVTAVAGIALLLGLLVQQLGAANATTSSRPSRGSAATPPRIFAYYYLWWSTSHWQSSLGPNYPITAGAKPLPATLDATGCNPRTNFTGNSLTDVPQQIHGQDDPGFIESEVREAAAAGLAGFAVNWAGTGSTTQTVTSNPYSKRLQILVDAVHKVNSEGIPFKLWLSYKSSASILSQSQIDADLGYFLSHYGNDPAFDRLRTNKVTIIWQGSRKYPISVLQAITPKYRSQARILGDETTWSADRGAYLDGNAYYWSSQDPYHNPQSFQQISALATAVRGSGPNPDGSTKTWIAPLAPGYDKQLAGGSNCVPRNGGQTLQRLFQGNLASNPDDFGLISWNEITEGTYIAPMTRYGQQDLAVVAALTKTSYSFPTYTYVASSRWRTAVYINGLVKSYSAQPQSARRAPGITIYLQRYLGGSGRRCSAAPPTAPAPWRSGSSSRRLPVPAGHAGDPKHP